MTSIAPITTLLVILMVTQYPGISGNPVENEIEKIVYPGFKGEARISRHGTRDWTGFHHSWTLPSFPSLPSVTSLFADEEETSLAKRVEAVEKSQKQILEILRKIATPIRPPPIEDKNESVFPSTGGHHSDNTVADQSSKVPSKPQTTETPKNVSVVEVTAPVQTEAGNSEKDKNEEFGIPSKGEKDNVSEKPVVHQKEDERQEKPLIVTTERPELNFAVTNVVQANDPKNPSENVQAKDPKNPSENVQANDPKNPSENVEVNDPKNPTESVQVNDTEKPTQSETNKPEKEKDEHLENPTKPIEDVSPPENAGPPSIVAFVSPSNEKSEVKEEASVKTENL